jgi:phage tail sheath gpL-like
MSSTTSPRTTFQIVGASVQAGVAGQQVLFVGQKLATGSAVAKAVTEDIQIGTEDTLFGNNSILSQMIKRARTVNKITRFDAIALDDNGSGSEAEGTVTFSGAATETADFVLQAGNDGFEYSITVTKDDTAAATATALAAAITAASTYPFTAAAVAEVVTITYVHEGTAGNEVKMQNTQGVAGITAVVVDLTGGAGVVDVANIFDNLEERYQTIIYSQDLDQAVLTDYTESVFNLANEIKDGIGFICTTDTLANAKTALDLLNLKTLVNLYNLDEMLYFDISTNMASEICALRALRLTEGAVLGSFVLDAVEAFGGREKASLPYFNTPMLSLNLPVGRLTQTNIDELIAAGGATFIPNPANQIVMSELPTTYKKDGTGTDDPSFQYTNYVDTMSVVREFFSNNVKSTYGQTRATNGSLVPGKSITNPAAVKTFVVGLYKTLIDDALVQGGDEAITFFKTNLIVSLDAASGTFSLTSKVPIVTQARRFDGVIAIAFEF